MKDHDFQNCIYRALTPVDKLLKEYKDYPSLENCTEKDVSWINDQIRCLWENLKKIDKKDFSTLREIRNNISHNKEEFTDPELKKMWQKVFPMLPKIKAQLESYLQKDEKNKSRRLFSKFGPSSCGSETERNQLIDAIEDECELADKDDKIEFPNNYLSQSSKQVLDEFFRDNDNRNYIHGHAGLSKNIQNDLLDWVKNVDEKLNTENPFEMEVSYISTLEKQSPNKICSSIDEIQKKYREFPTGKNCSVDFDFYKNKISELTKDTKRQTEKVIEHKDIRQKALVSSFMDSLKKDLFERKSKWELNLIDEMRKKFLRELSEKLEKFRKLEKVLSNIFDETGFLWDLSTGMFKESGFEVLKQFAELLENDKSLMELAEILGKHSRTQKEYEKELRKKTVITTEYHPKPAFKGQIAGIRMSNDISSVLPTELALLKNPATKNLFQLKFVQQQLLSFKYENIIPEKKTVTVQEEISKGKEKKGPVIICVDTSGSMNGTPENIAKTITLALSKIAAKEKRDCYLISFSTGIETLDLCKSSYNEENPVSKLIKFLRMSFNRGTDAVPALSHALKMLKDENYKNADVLMISDFVMGGLGQNLKKKIMDEQKNKTDFYSLVIGTSGSDETIKCFNHNWFYDMNDKNAARHLVEKINSIGKNKKDKNQSV